MHVHVKEREKKKTKANPQRENPKETEQFFFILCNIQVLNNY